MTKKTQIKEEVVELEPSVEEFGVATETQFNEGKYKERIKKWWIVFNDEKTNATLKNKAEDELIRYQVAINLKIPASGIDVLKRGEKKPYINTGGLLYKTFELAKSREPAGIKSISAIPLKDSDGNPIVSKEIGQTSIFVGTVELNNGEKYIDIGEANEINTPIKSLNSMAARRATNRAMRLFTQIALTSVEEMESSEPVKKSKSLITDKEMNEISDLLFELENSEDKDAFDKAKDKYKEKKATLSENQIINLERVIDKKDATL